MVRSIKIFILKLITPILARFGFYRDGDNYGKNNLLHTFFTTLIKIGFVPNHIVDVGANHGTWTRETLKYFPDANFTLLEPQSRMQESIRDLLVGNPRIKFNAVGAGEKAGTFKFTIVDRDDSCSFAYTEEEARAMGFQQIEVPVITLNDFLPKTGLPIPDIIKIDAEGLDIEVLKGANQFFGKTEIFMVEAGVVNKIFGNSILRIINFMDEQGYRLFEITDLNRPFPIQVLWLVELVFIKKNGLVDSNKYV